MKDLRAIGVKAPAETQMVHILVSLDGRKLIFKVGNGIMAFELLLSRLKGIDEK